MGGQAVGRQSRPEASSSFWGGVPTTSVAKQPVLGSNQGWEANQRGTPPRALTTNREAAAPATASTASGCIGKQTKQPMTANSLG